MAPLNYHRLQPRGSFFMGWDASYKFFFIFAGLFVLVLVAGFIVFYVKRRRMRQYHQIGQNVHASTTLMQNAAAVTTATDAPGIAVNDTLIVLADDSIVTELGKSEPLFGTHALRAGQYTRGVVVCEETFKKPSRNSIFAVKQPSLLRLEEDLVISSIPSGSSSTIDGRRSIPSRVYAPTPPPTQPVLARAPVRRLHSDATGDIADGRVQVVEPIAYAPVPLKSSGESSSTEQSRPSSGKAVSMDSATSGSHLSAHSDPKNALTREFRNLADSHRLSMAAETGDLNRPKRITAPSLVRPVTQPDRAPVAANAVYPQSARIRSLNTVDYDFDYRDLGDGELPYLMHDTGSNSSMDTLLSGQNPFTTPDSSRPSSLNLEPDIIDSDPEDARTTTIRIRSYAPVHNSSEDEAPHTLDYRQVNSGFAVGRGKRMDGSAFTEEEVELVRMGSSGGNKLRKSLSSAHVDALNAKRRSSLFGRLGRRSTTYQEVQRV